MHSLKLILKTNYINLWIIVINQHHLVSQIKNNDYDQYPTNLFPILQKKIQSCYIARTYDVCRPFNKILILQTTEKKKRLAVGVCYTQKDFNQARKSPQIIQHLLRELPFLTTKQTLILWLKCLQLRKNIFVLHCKFNHNESRIPFSWTIKPNFFTFVICN